MQSHRIISGLTVFLMVVLVAVGYLLVAQPQLAAASAANDQLASVNAQIVGSQAKITLLKSEQTKLPTLTEQLAALRQSIPGDAQISSYIDGLNAMASANGVSITGITVAAAQSYSPPVGAVIAPPASSTATPAPTPTAAAAPVTPAAPSVWTPTTEPSITSANFVAIPVTVVTSGPTANTLSFINSLQTGTRLFLVSGISTTVATGGGNAIAATIQGYLYVLIDATTTATSKPTATPTAAPSPSGTATPTPTQSPTPTKKP